MEAKKENKRQIIPIILIFLGIMLIVAAYFTVSTFSKYSTAISGTGSATVAKWVAGFDGTDGSTTTGTATINVVNTLNDSGVAGDLLAPGTSGSFDVVFKTSGTQVARKVVISIDTSAFDSLTHLKLCSDSGCTTSVTDGTILDATFGPTGSLVSGTLFGAAATGITEDDRITVYWEWPFEDSPSTAAYDAIDTAAGVAGGSAGTLTVNFSATQLDTIP